MTTVVELDTAAEEKEEKSAPLLRFSYGRGKLHSTIGTGVEPRGIPDGRDSNADVEDERISPPATPHGVWTGTSFFTAGGSGGVRETRRECSSGSDSLLGIQSRRTDERRPPGDDWYGYTICDLPATHRRPAIPRDSCTTGSGIRLLDSRHVLQSSLQRGTSVFVP